MAFQVYIAKMVESHRETYLVTLINKDIRAKDADIFDSTGKITPFMSENLEYAEMEAATWADFLGTTVDKYDYI